MDHREILGKLTPEGKASLLSGRDFWSTRPLEEYGIPSVVFSDGPHGVRRQAEKSDHIGLNKSLPATCFPRTAGMFRLRKNRAGFWEKRRLRRGRGSC